LLLLLLLRQHWEGCKGKGQQSAGRAKDSETGHESPPEKLELNGHKIFLMSSIGQRVFAA
jgi:hypothetical protein